MEIDSSMELVYRFNSSRGREDCYGTPWGKVMLSKHKLFNRVMASLGGVIVLALDAVPLGVSLWFVCYCASNDCDCRAVVVGCVSTFLFGTIAWFAVRNIVQSCKDVSEMERFIGSLSASERSEFQRTIGKAEDVEVWVDERGRRTFVPWGSDESEDSRRLN